MKEFKSRDKLTQRMTRDGAVLDNRPRVKKSIFPSATPKSSFPRMGSLSRWENATHL